MDTHLFGHEVEVLMRLRCTPERRIKSMVEDRSHPELESTRSRTRLFFQYRPNERSARDHNGLSDQKPGCPSVHHPGLGVSAQHHRSPAQHPTLSRDSKIYTSHSDIWSEDVTLHLSVWSLAGVSAQ